MFTSTGRLEYYKNPLKLIVKVDPEISRYYFEQATKIAHIDLNRQRYAAHISVVRREKPLNMRLWNKYHNQLVEFNYEHYLYNNHVYYWLNAWSEQLELIREELGLARVSEFTRGPDNRHRWHITIGNVKDLNETC